MADLVRAAIYKNNAELPKRVNRLPDYRQWLTHKGIKRIGSLLAAGIDPENVPGMCRESFKPTLPTEANKNLRRAWGGADEYGFMTEWGALQHSTREKFAVIFAAWVDLEDTEKPVAEWLVLAQEHGFFTTALSLSRESIAEYQAALLVEDLMRQPLSDSWTKESQGFLRRISEHQEPSQSKIQSLLALRQKLSGYEEIDGSPEQECFFWLRQELRARKATADTGQSLAKWLDELSVLNADNSPPPASINDGSLHLPRGLTTHDLVLTMGGYMDVNNPAKVLSGYPDWATENQACLQRGKPGKPSQHNPDISEWNPVQFALNLLTKKPLPRISGKGGLTIAMLDTAFGQSELAPWRAIWRKESQAYRR